MLKVAMSILVLGPAVLAAQVTAKAAARSDAKASAHAGDHAAVSATSATSVDAEVVAARRRNMPEEPIRRRAAEGRVKGASEAQVAVAARKLRVNMETALDAMVAAGRERPSEDEIERGGYAVERGYTRAQIEAMVKSASSDRSLVVAFDVLARLSARGVPVTNALAQVGSRLESRADDASIEALVGATAGARTTAPGVKAGAAGATGVTGTAGAAGATAGGTVTGTVTGVIKP